MIHIHLSAFFKIPCWVEGFLDSSLCCSTPLFWAESWKFLLGILELTQRYLSLHIPRLVVGVQHAIKLLPAILVSKRRWRTVLSMLVSICVGIDKQTSYALLSCRKSKHQTLKVTTGYYIITLCSAFSQIIKVGYSLSLLLL